SRTTVSPCSTSRSTPRRTSRFPNCSFRFLMLRIVPTAVTPPQTPLENIGKLQYRVQNQEEHQRNRRIGLDRIEVYVGHQSRLTQQLHVAYHRRQGGHLENLDSAVGERRDHALERDRQDDAPHRLSAPHAE